MQLPNVRVSTNREEYIAKLAPSLFMESPRNYFDEDLGAPDAIYRAGLLFDKLHALSIEATATDPGTTVDWSRLQYVEAHAPTMLSKFNRPGDSLELVTLAISMAGTFYDGLNNPMQRQDKAAKEADDQLQRVIRQEIRAIHKSTPTAKAETILSEKTYGAPTHKSFLIEQAEDARMTAWIMDATAVKSPDVAARHAALIAKYYPDVAAALESPATIESLGL